MMAYEKELASLRALLLGPRKFPLKAPEIRIEEVRSKALRILLDLVDRTNNRIKSAGKRAAKGSGGISEFVRLCQLQGYLIQVMNSLLESLEGPEIERRIQELERIAARVEEERSGEVGEA